MAKIRKIDRKPSAGKNYYVVDACFLANKFIPANRAPSQTDRDRIDGCMKWWDEIDAQLAAGNARVYVPDVCIAEAFKVLAKKYYQEKWYRSAVELNNARNRMRQELMVSSRTLRAARRVIKYHDIPTSRDFILAVDRFYELFQKHKKNVSLPDLLLVAAAKYLIDFFDLPPARIHIVTMDSDLWAGCKKIQELPNAYDPTRATDTAARVFR